MTQAQHQHLNNTPKNIIKWWFCRLTCTNIIDIIDYYVIFINHAFVACEKHFIDKYAMNEGQRKT